MTCEPYSHIHGDFLKKKMNVVPNQHHGVRFNFVSDAPTVSINRNFSGLYDRARKKFLYLHYRMYNFLTWRQVYRVVDLSIKSLGIVILQ